MKHNTVTFRGPAALPGVFLTLTRVNRGRALFFSFMQTGHLMAGRAFSPLCSISHQLVSEFRDYPLKKKILSKGWDIEQCAFRMWLIGPINQHPACKGFTFSFHDWCIIAWLLAAMINQHLEGLGHETVLPKFGLTDPSKHNELEQIARMLLEEFLRDLAPSLLEDMDLEFDKNQE